MPESRQSQAPFRLTQGTVVLAILALAGVFLFLRHDHATTFDLGILDDFDREAARRRAEAFLLDQTARQSLPGTIILSSNPDDATAKAFQVLRTRFAPTEITDLIRARKLPAPYLLATWLDLGTGVEARVGVDAWNRIVFYQPVGLTLSAPAVSADSISNDQLIALARDFAERRAGIDPKEFPAPTLSSSAEGQEDTVQWTRPAFAGFNEIVSVVFRKKTFAKFIRRIEPAQPVKLEITARIGNIPITTENPVTLVAAIASLLKYLLLLPALWYLFKIYRKQKLFLRLPLVVGGIEIGLSSVFILGVVLPVTMFGSVLRAPGLETVGTWTVILSLFVGTFLTSLVATTFSALCASVGFLTCLHLEADTQRDYTRTLRDIFQGRFLPLPRLARELLLGFGFGAVMLGVSALLARFSPPFNVYAFLSHPESYGQLGMWVDCEMPRLTLQLIGLMAALRFTIFDALFVWLMLRLKFRLSWWWCFPAMIPFVCASYTGGALFSNWIMLAVSTGVFMLGAYVLERYGAWVLLVAMWTFQAAELVAALAAVPHVGLTGWMYFTVAAPALSLLLAWRDPTLTGDDRPLEPTLLDQYVEEIRYERQLQIASRIQTEFLPRTVPILPGWDLAVRSLPALEVGGDFYDFIPLENNHIGLVVGDISGKSVPGALFMGVAATAFRSEAEEMPPDCAPLLETLNQLLFADMKRARMFAAAAYTVLETTTGRIKVANAGLPQPLLYSAAEKRGQYLDVSGMPLGSMRQSQYQEGEATLTGGDILVIASDGVVEAINERDEMYGYDALQRLVETNSHLTARELLDTIYRTVREYSSEVAQSDDITVVVLKRLR